MESIEKLREWGKQHKGWELFDFQISEIADEIEAEIESRYMELPMDADGVPIHLRDKLLCDDTGEAFIVSGYESELPDGEGVLMPAGDDRDEAYYPKTLRHVKPRTIEDVLDEFMHAAADACTDANFKLGDIIKEYADEIRGML